MDLVSDVIAVLRTGRPSASRVRVSAAHRYRFDDYQGAGFHMLLRGGGWLLRDGAEPVALGPGDLVFLPHGTAHVLSDAPSAAGAVPFDQARPDSGGGVEFLCGKYRLDRAITHPLLAELPDVVHLPAGPGRSADLRAAVELLGAELHADRPGRQAVVTGLLDLLLVYLLRAGLDGAGGWRRALWDAPVAAALEAMHTDPARPWRIEQLAALAGLSRATLVRRFARSVGQPPMSYLTRWRMTLAARLLRDTELPLSVVAARVGYASPFAFSHVFKRRLGLAPGQYRSRQRPDPGAADPTPPVRSSG
ncbi:AraC family transcriptional regulator [Actinocatenispora sera]|uniref:AraC family transcriptional regulator n=1 Tax=Actinocatenispora sera TaxID=390989 RepID=A0A810LA63_9ACTN|nr:AraC family transcriptional regulator [Actinocatenispora sera]BCJ32137.1 AraC family transcriptional regulator [Actinocatenispora sera]